MSREDPYFVVKDDVTESLDKAEVALQTFESKKQQNAPEATITELGRALRNSLRSIEWDVEDLQETVGIVEKAPHKFNLTSADVAERRDFISSVKQRLSHVKNQFETSTNPNATSKKSNREKQSLLSGGQSSQYASGQSTRQPNSSHGSATNSNSQFIEETKQQQQLLIRAQDEQIDNIGASVQVLKNISTHIGTELEEQSVLLDDFGHEMENTGSKMDSTMKKIAKVTKMSTDKRQWCAIGVLIVIVIILIILISTLK